VKQKAVKKREKGRKGGAFPQGAAAEPFCRPLRGLLKEIIGGIPGWRAALTLGYCISRFQRDEFADYQLAPYDALPHGRATAPLPTR